MLSHEKAGHICLFLLCPVANKSESSAYVGAMYPAKTKTSIRGITDLSKMLM